MRATYQGFFSTESYSVQLYGGVGVSAPFGITTHLILNEDTLLWS